MRSSKVRSVMEQLIPLEDSAWYQGLSLLGRAPGRALLGSISPTLAMACKKLDTYLTSPHFGIQMGPKLEGSCPRTPGILLLP